MLTFSMPHLDFLVCNHFLFSRLFFLIREDQEASSGVVAEAR